MGVTYEMTAGCVVSDRDSDFSVPILGSMISNPHWNYELNGESGFGEP